jgi:hypothetical protein
MLGYKVQCLCLINTDLYLNACMSVLRSDQNHPLNNFISCLNNKNSGHVNYILWYVHPLLGNDREQAAIQQPLLSNSSTNKHISTAMREYSIMEQTFSMPSMPRCYNHNQLPAAENCWVSVVVCCCC